MATWKRPAHAWTQEQRVCVQILWEEHNLSKDDSTKLFNEIFKDCFVVGDGRTWASLAAERYRRLQDGSRSRKAWQAACGIVDDVQEHFMVDRMRMRVNSLLRANNESLTPSRSTSSDSNAQTTAVLWDVEKFARFTESAPRKRNIAGLCTPPSTADERADDFEETPRTKRSCRAPRAQSPTVMIPKACDIQTVHTVVEAEESPTGASSSDRSSETTRHVAATEQNSSVVGLQPQHDENAPVSYHRMGNVPLMLSPAKYKDAPPTEAPYYDISEEDAHPCLPSLFWRYWDYSSQGTNSASGFKSGRSAHARAPLRGPPLCKNLEWIDVLEHLNPSKNLELRIHSPFISTSSRLLSILRKALRKGDPSSRISVIDSSALDPKAVYYVPPFHAELKRHLVFDNGAQYYKGISEHLVWQEIASSAMIKTVSLDELIRFVNGNRDVKQLMRLDKIASRSKLDEISRTLKRDCVKITDSIVVAIAELVMFFGLGHTSSGESLSRLVYEIAQGWALTLDGVTQSSWQTKAQWFTHTICRRSDEPVSFIEQSKIYHA